MAQGKLGAVLLRLVSASTQVIPPLLLSYFWFAWRACVNDIGPYLSTTYHPLIGNLHTVLATLLILSITVLYLRLYFLPSNQSLPTFNPPPEITERRVVFECLAPEEASLLDHSARRTAGENGSAGGITGPDGRNFAGDDDGVKVNRCWKDKCKGRWKPARARHCSDCGVCRAGFDHHCPFFANCLTVPHIPVFLLVLLLTPPTFLLVATPILLPLIRRLIQAYTFSRSSDKLRWWWDWWLSWVVFFGPTGRFGGGTILGWRELDRLDDSGLGGGVVKLRNGVFVLLGFMLSAVCCGLAYTTITLVLAGNLTIDHARKASRARTIHAIRALEKASKPIPSNLTTALERWSSKRYFFVPLPEFGEGAGEVIQTGEQDVYDHGRKANWEMIMGEGWGWVLPWSALRRGMGKEIYNWPVDPEVERRLVEEARERYRARRGLS